MTARADPKPAKSAAKKRTPKKGGAPFGNQNAKGRRGGAPVGNKRAVKTGEFERIFFDSITDDERLMMQEVALDKIRILRDELILLTIRERRMMIRIAEYTDEQGRVLDLRTIVTENEHREAAKKDKPEAARRMKTSSRSTSHVRENTADLVGRIEEALTRVQTRKHAIVEQIHKIEQDEILNEIARDRLALGAEESRYRIEQIKANTARLSGVDSGMAAAAMAQTAAIADLINYPVEPRTLDDFMEGADLE